MRGATSYAGVSSNVPWLQKGHEPKRTLAVKGDAYWDQRTNLVDSEMPQVNIIIKNKRTADENKVRVLIVMSLLQAYEKRLKGDEPTEVEAETSHRARVAEFLVKVISFFYIESEPFGKS